MNFPARTLGLRRIASLTLVAILGLAVIGPSTAAAATAPVETAAIGAAEQAMIVALNRDRTDRGLVRVVADSRLMAIARARSVDMVAKNYFSHVQPDGRNVFDIIRAENIAWFGAGEIIAWNTHPMDQTVGAANDQWMNSPGHRAIVVSTSYNYVGVGLAVDAASGRKLWTAVYLKGPDRTAARATAGTATVKAGPTATTRSVRVTWSGYDPRLQVLTAGLGSFALQSRSDGGSFRSVWSMTGQTSANFNLPTGHRFEFRIAARDRNGNLGAWTTKVIDLR